MVLFETYEDFYIFRKKFFDARMFPFLKGVAPICIKFVKNLMAQTSTKKFNINNNIIYRHTYFEVENKYLSKANLYMVCAALTNINYRLYNADSTLYNERFYIRNSTGDLIEYAIGDTFGTIAFCPLQYGHYYKTLTKADNVSAEEWFVTDENKLFCIDLVEYIIDNKFTLVHQIDDDFIDIDATKLFVSYKPVREVVYLFTSIMLMLFSSVQDTSSKFIDFVKGYISYADKRLTVSPNIISDYKNKLNVQNYYVTTLSDLVLKDYYRPDSHYTHDIKSIQHNTIIECESLPNYSSIGLKIYPDINESLKANDPAVHTAFINRYLSECVLAGRCYGFPIVGNQVCTGKFQDELKKIAKFNPDEELPDYISETAETSDTPCGDIICMVEDCGISLENFGFYIRCERNIYDIDKSKLFSIDNIKEMLFNAIWTLKTMHDSNIVHCDLHQNNIVINYSNYKYNIDKRNVFTYYSYKNKVWRLKKSSFSLSLIDFGESLLLCESPELQDEFLKSLDVSTYNDLYYNFDFDVLKSRSIKYLKSVVSENVDEFTDLQRINLCKIIDLKKLLLTLSGFFDEEILSDKILSDKKAFRSKDDLKVFHKFLDIDVLNIPEETITFIKKLNSIAIDSTTIDLTDSTTIDSIYSALFAEFEAEDKFYEEYNEYTELYKIDNKLLEDDLFNYLNVAY